MTSVAIMQPTFLPWIGYFALMDQVNIFVFLDSVQFDKRSWQQRNRIRTKQGELFLTVPVYSKGKKDQKILDVEIDTTQKFKKKHLSSIYSNYSKAEFFKEYWLELQEIYEKKTKMLIELNLNLIHWITEKIGIETEFIRSSEIPNKGEKADLLFNICKVLNAKKYVSPLGSKNYLVEHNPFENSPVELNYIYYDQPQYQQVFTGFVPYLSALDLLMNEGNSSLDIMRSGYKQNS